MNSLNRDREEDKIQLLIRKYLYIDPMSLKQWEDTAKMWGDTCKVCGKPMIPNKYADEFEKKMIKLIRTLLEEAKAEERKRCLEALPKVDNEVPDIAWRAGFNQAIFQATKALSSLPQELSSSKRV